MDSKKVVLPCLLGFTRWVKQNNENKNKKQNDENKNKQKDMKQNNESKDKNQKYIFERERKSY